jgi:hypothetical protein
MFCMNMGGGFKKYKHCFDERFKTCVKKSHTFQLRSKMLLAKERLVNINFLRIILHVLFMFFLE